MFDAMTAVNAVVSMVSTGTVFITTKASGIKSAAVSSTGVTV
jgi:hypothetical protein